MSIRNIAELPADVRLALGQVLDRLGASAGGTSLLHFHSNAIIAVPSADLVIRIATNPNAESAVASSIAVTRWLAGRGFPCVVPTDHPGQPWNVEGKTVSLWRRVHETDGPPATAADLGQLLRRLHEQPPAPEPLQPLTDPLAGIATAMELNPEALSDADPTWLRGQIIWLGDRWRALSFRRPAGLIHGDAHTGNLVRDVSGQVILADWDHVAHGPREWDLIQPYYLHRRFGRADVAELDAFAEAYGWDPRTWTGLTTLIAIRELSGLSPYVRKASFDPVAKWELGHRLQTLQSRESDARWHSSGELL